MQGYTQPPPESTGIRELIRRHAYRLQLTLGDTPAVAELHINPDDPADSTVYGPTPLSLFLSVWGREEYMGDYVVRPEDWDRQYVGIIDPRHGNVLLVGLQPGEVASQ